MTQLPERNLISYTGRKGQALPCRPLVILKVLARKIPVRKPAYRRMVRASSLLLTNNYYKVIINKYKFDYSEWEHR